MKRIVPGDVFVVVVISELRAKASHGSSRICRHFSKDGRAAHDIGSLKPMTDEVSDAPM